MLRIRLISYHSQEPGARSQEFKDCRAKATSVWAGLVSVLKAFTRLQSLEISYQNPES